DRATPRLDELDQPVGGIERELHVPRLSNVRSYLKPVASADMSSGASPLAEPSKVSLRTETRV
ncbi:MAG: hypothetical protein WD380_12710, partial [Gaiellaceae bacterium]